MTQFAFTKVKRFHTREAYLISTALPDFVLDSRKYRFFIYFYITGIDSRDSYSEH